MTTRRIVMMALAAGFMMLGQAATATAQEVTYSVRNDHPNTVELEFYSADRDVAWPGGGNAFILDDGEPHSLPLACEEGERVCYGAWVQGDSSITWGAGPGGEMACDDCCYICGTGDTPLIVLVGQ